MQLRMDYLILKKLALRISPNSISRKEQYL